MPMVRINLPEFGTASAQLNLIKELLEELDWCAVDIADCVGDEYADYAKLDYDMAGELISYLIDEKRSRG